MKAITRLSQSPDIWGSLASGLCLAHCVATPFIFAAHAGHIQDHFSPVMGWGALDLLFIIISFLAVFWSSRHTTKRWMSYALWISWGLLTIVILNEKLNLFPIIEAAIYIPSITLIVLHIYNHKYCRCTDKKCCIHTFNSKT